MFQRTLYLPEKKIKYISFASPRLSLMTIWDIWTYILPHKISSQHSHHSQMLIVRPRLILETKLWNTATNSLISETISSLPTSKFLGKSIANSSKQCKYEKHQVAANNTAPCLLRIATVSHQEGGWLIFSYWVTFPRCLVVLFPNTPIRKSWPWRDLLAQLLILVMKAC